MSAPAAILRWSGLLAVLAIAGIAPAQQARAPAAALAEVVPAPLPRAAASTPMPAASAPRAAASASTGAASAGTASGSGTASAAAQVARGAYLVHAGDCASCHTVDPAKPFAGGFGVKTPFGTIYASNITPDRQTGIGDWSADDFYRAMHEGRDKHGEHLYPAFPYPWFTKLSRADVDAIKAWLDTLRPIAHQVREPDLPWPLSWRFMMVGWNLLFFHEGEFKPDSAKSDVWNRGAYLVEGAGHCGACHTPMNFLGGSKKDQAFRGETTPDHWFAANLTDTARRGLGEWSQHDIVELLKTGSNARASATGSMAEVVENSTQYLSDADLNAIAFYLKDLPGRPASEEADTPPMSKADLARGEALYLDNCTGCHMEDGSGIAHVFPPLRLNPVLQGRKADTVVQLVLQGHATPATPAKPAAMAMPGFAGKLTDQEVADVVNYARNAWGNVGPAVSSDVVATIRKNADRTGLDGSRQALQRPQAVRADTLGTVAGGGAR